MAEIMEYFEMLSNWIFRPISVNCLDCFTSKDIVDKMANALALMPDTSSVSILSWNYSSKTKKQAGKFDLLRSLDSDILIIQECTYYECISFKKFYKYVSWYGDGKDSMLGIGIFSNKFEPHLFSSNMYEQKFRYVVPYEINIFGVNFLLLAVWTKKALKRGDEKDNVHCLSYIENVYEAIDFYDGLLRKYTDVIIIGDFNSFDKKQKRNERHIKLEDKLKQYDIFNCASFSEYTDVDRQDFETKATYYHRYNPDNPGTDDYCFLKKSENTWLQGVGIGRPEKWIQYSDHFPLLIWFSVKNP